MNLLRLNKNVDFIAALLRIQKTIPSAIIAGGLIRDLYHDKPIKDVDIYVPLDAPDYNDEVSTCSRFFWNDIFKLKSSNDYIENMDGEGDEDYDSEDIGMVWEISAQNRLYNIIVVNEKPIDYVEKHFDIGLCKVYCDGKKIRLTSEFLHDSRFKKLTIVSKNIKQEEFARMMNYHVKKLKDKYPDHTLVIPPMYDKFYKLYIKNKKHL